MGLPEQILTEISGLSEIQKREVLDFAKFLRQKEERELTDLMKTIVSENIEAFKELAK